MSGRITGSDVGSAVSNALRRNARIVPLSGTYVQRKYFMPIYEYTCDACRNGFEELVRKMSAEDRPACPKCGSTRTARKLSVFAVGAEGSRAGDENAAMRPMRWGAGVMPNLKFG